MRVLSPRNMKTECVSTRRNMTNVSPCLASMGKSLKRVRITYSGKKSCR